MPRHDDGIIVRAPVSKSRSQPDDYTAVCRKVAADSLREVCLAAAPAVVGIVSFAARARSSEEAIPLILTAACAAE